MADEPQLHEADRHDEQEVSAWLASEAFINFMTATFGVAVMHAVEKHAAEDMIPPR